MIKRLHLLREVIDHLLFCKSIKEIILSILIPSLLVKVYGLLLHIYGNLAFQFPRKMSQVVHGVHASNGSVYNYTDISRIVEFRFLWYHCEWNSRHAIAICTRQDPTIEHVLVEAKLK